MDFKWNAGRDEFLNLPYILSLTYSIIVCVMSIKDVQAVTGRFLTDRRFVEMFAVARPEGRVELLQPYNLTDVERYAFVDAIGEDEFAIVACARLSLIFSGLYTEQEI